MSDQTPNASSARWHSAFRRFSICVPTIMPCDSHHHLMPSNGTNPPVNRYPPTTRDEQAAVEGLELQAVTRLRTMSELFDHESHCIAEGPAYADGLAYAGQLYSQGSNPVLRLMLPCAKYAMKDLEKLRRLELQSSGTTRSERGHGSHRSTTGHHHSRRTPLTEQESEDTPLDFSQLYSNWPMYHYNLSQAQHAVFGTITADATGTGLAFDSVEGMQVFVIPGGDTIHRPFQRWIDSCMSVYRDPRR